MHDLDEVITRNSVAEFSIENIVQTGLRAALITRHQGQQTLRVLRESLVALPLQLASPLPAGWGVLATSFEYTPQSQRNQSQPDAFESAVVTFAQNVSSIRVGPKESPSKSTKHEVSFEEAITVFADPLARIFNDDDHSSDERREIIIGHSAQQNLILVSFTGIDKRVRLFSARKATRTERKDYEENVGS